VVDKKDLFQRVRCGGPVFKKNQDHRKFLETPVRHWLRLRFSVKRVFPVCFLKLGRFLVLPVLLPNALWSQDSIPAVFVDTPPKIDGRVVEAVWSKAAMVDKFLQREPDPGEPVSQKTEFFVCYDKNNLYIAAKCYDDPKKIIAKQLEWDANLNYDDKIVIILDTFHDHRNSFWCQLNSVGCVGDAIQSQNGASRNKEWDGLWESKAAINEHGWDVEVKIPFKTLSFHRNQETWGIKFERDIARRSEQSYWPVANPDSYEFQVSDAGHLTGLKGISQGIGLDIRPYALGGVNQRKTEASKYLADSGLDLFYQVAPGIKSALTLNPDFAQTEVDDNQINLTRFPIFYPEKRDFMLDGASYFQFGLEGDRTNDRAKSLVPFFSRRLGLDNDRNPIPVVWGVKASGQAGDWNMGLMDVADKRERGNKNFSVVRISRNFGSQSMIGLIGTSGNAVSDTRNSVFGIDMRLATSKFQGDKNLALSLYGLKSNTSRVSNNDFAFGGEVNYPNDFLSFRMGYIGIERNVQFGTGFIPRNDFRNTYVETGLGPRPRRWGVLQFQVKTAFDYITDTNNRMLNRSVSFTPLGIRFNSGDEFRFQVGNLYEFLPEDDVISSIGVKSGSYSYWQYNLMLSTTQRRDLWILGNYTWGGFYDGNRKTTSIQSGYKISMPLFVGFGLEYTDGTLSTVDFVREVYRLRINFLFSPNITLNNFVQYDNFTKRMGWQSRFRWILKPGNEINLIWNSISLNPFERFEITEGVARAKIQYNYRF